MDFGREVAAREHAACEREWLAANGSGGFAMGTVAHLRTRGYHALLVAALQPPSGRTVLVSGVEETAVVRGSRYPLFTGRSGPAAPLRPRGFEYHERFRLEGTIPVWTFALGDVRLEKRIWMEHGRNSTYVRYDHAGGDAPVRLEVGVLVEHRDYHEATAEPHDLPAEEVPGGIRVVPPGGTSFTVTAAGASVEPSGEWCAPRFLDAERYRGEVPWTRDLHAATLTLLLEPGASATLVASVPGEADPAGALERRRARDRALLAGREEEPGWVRRLALAADQFVVARPAGGTGGVSVIAGYPWFTDWGRDTMIALPGLLLETGRHPEAAAVLRTFAAFVDRGMIPNRFPDAGEEPEYNTIDATLWFADAAGRVVDAAGDLGLAADLFPVLEDVVSHHLAGTRYGIRADPGDGLLRGGEPGVQLTWMDARIDEWVVTPRIGKPVEVNALWYRALRVVARLARLLGGDGSQYDATADRVRASFDRFWNPAAGWCFDVLDGPDGDDPSLRPNQVLAVSLEPDLVSDDRARAILAACERWLHASLGLRSLAPFDDAYRPWYGGPRRIRDGAYHQGTVWSWLIGPFVTAHLRVRRDPQAAAALLEPFVAHLGGYGLGSIAECADGDPPHTPRAAPFQAWGVAAVLAARAEIAAAGDDG